MGHIWHEAEDLHVLTVDQNNTRADVNLDCLIHLFLLFFVYRQNNPTINHKNNQYINEWIKMLIRSENNDNNW